MPAEMNIEVPRNGNYFKGWTLEDDLGNPLDITGWTLRLQARPVAGAGGAAIASALISGRDDAQGFFNVRLRGSDFAAVPGSMEIVKLAYDFIAFDADNIVIVETRGQIHLIPGVTI